MNSAAVLLKMNLSLVQSLDDEIENDGELTVDGTSASFPIYKGAEATIFERYILAFQFSMRLSLTKKAFSELL